MLFLIPKLKVKEKVLELSKKLIEIYALREASVGHKFSPDSTEQIEFESEFTYDETPDQIMAINAVKDCYGIDVGDDVAEATLLARSAFKLPKLQIEK